MKRIIMIAAALSYVMGAAAEGYQVNLQSARQAGMGHVGTGMKLGSESMHFNPAGLTSVNTMDLSAGVALLKATAHLDGKSGSTAVDSKTDNSISTPIYLYAGFNVWKNKLFAGVSVNNPYGSGLNWGKDWAGNKLIQEISMRAFSIQPTLAYKINDQWSVGAGLMIVTGDFSMNKALMVNSDLGALKNTTIPDAAALASLGLKGTSKLGYGYNLGIQYDVTPELTLGLSYRSQMSVKVDNGSSETLYTHSGAEALSGAISYLNNAIGALPDDNPQKSVLTETRNALMTAQGTFTALNGKTVEAELPLPSNLSFGASYRVNPKLTLAADFQYIAWQCYDTLQINLKELGAAGVTKMVKNYKNSFAIRVGGEYSLCPHTDVRLGFAYDKTPVDKNWYSPETPGADKYIITAGSSIKLYKNLGFDLGLQYVLGQKDGKYPTSPTTTFGGEYTTTAFSASLGLNYKF